MSASGIIACKPVTLFWRQYWGGPKNKGNQQNANEPQDHILAVSSDGVAGAEAVSTGPKPVGEGDAICVQHIQTEKSQIIGTKTVWGWVNLYMSTNNVKLLIRDPPRGPHRWSVWYPKDVNLAGNGLVYFPNLK